jgi:hypothetical protein
MEILYQIDLRTSLIYLSPTAYVSLQPVTSLSILLIHVSDPLVN